MREPSLTSASSVRPSTRTDDLPHRTAPSCAGPPPSGFIPRRLPVEWSSRKDARNPPIGPGHLRRAGDPAQDDDLVQLEVGDRRHGLGGQDDLAPVPARGAGHLRGQVGGHGVQPELGLVEDDGRRRVGPRQQGGQADEAQRAVTGLPGQKGAIRPPLSPPQPDPFRGIGAQDEVVEDRA